jgi:phosphopantetheinyl transferase
VLTSAELDQWRSVNGDRRRQEWVTGRKLAKVAVMLQAGSSWLSRPARQFEIVTDEFNRPRVCCWTTDGLTEFEISLSHSLGICACASRPVCSRDRIGVDVERISADILRDIGRFTSEYERANLLSLADPAAAATVIWSIKEAAIKWHGGITARRRAFEVSISWEKQRARVWCNRKVAPQLSNVELTGQFRLLGQYVLAWVESKESRESIVYIDDIDRVFIEASERYGRLCDPCRFA